MDNEIVSNTINLKENYVAMGNVYHSQPITIQNSNEDQIVEMSKLSEAMVPVNSVYLSNWKMYYVITTTMFNEIAKDFSSARLLY